MSGYKMNWKISANEKIWIRQHYFIPKNKFNILTLLRVRNEELILEDTLNHICGFSDIICAYDDASTDNTMQILLENKKVAMIIQNFKWLERIEDRLLSETRHRGLLLQEAKRRWPFRWCMCCDADERYVGPIREFA
jgi:glycosyltransferase involved in cell wall biosynthesis